MQGLVHAVLIKIIKAYTFPFMTRRGKTTTHSSQNRGDGKRVVRKHPHLAAQAPPSPLHPEAPRNPPVRNVICPQNQASPPLPAAKGG